MEHGHTIQNMVNIRYVQKIDPRPDFLGVQFSLNRKEVGGERERPHCSRLGRDAWQATTQTEDAAFTPTERTPAPHPTDVT